MIWEISLRLLLKLISTKHCSYIDFSYTRIYLVSPRLWREIVYIMLYNCIFCFVIPNWGSTPPPSSTRPEPEPFSQKKHVLFRFSSPNYIIFMMSKINFKLNFFLIAHVIIFLNSDVLEILLASFLIILRTLVALFLKTTR